MKTAFTPIRQWKRRRRNRNMHQRMVRRRWYQKNKSRLKTKRKQRYQQLRKNPTWKRWRQKLRKERNKRRMIASDPAPIFGISVGQEGLWLGILDSLDPDADVIRARSVKTLRPVCIPLDIFLQTAGFTDPNDEYDFWAVLEHVYGQEPAVTP